MSFATKHNKGGIDWGIDSIESFRFMKPEEAFKANGADYAYCLNGMYINKKSNYGEHGVLIDCAHELLIDAPAHLNEEIKNILKDVEDVADIKAGKVGFQIYTYTDDKYKKECYGIRWIDLQPVEGK